MDASPIDSARSKSPLAWLEALDVKRVIELLKTTAVAFLMWRRHPRRVVYVVNFTAGAVTFQLRAWTDRHEAWTQLRSDLSIAINDALAREKIAIA